MPYIEANLNTRKDILLFLNMVKLKERKLRWAFREKANGKKNKYIAFMLGIKSRRFQQLYAQYKKTGEVPKLNY